MKARACQGLIDEPEPTVVVQRRSIGPNCCVPCLMWDWMTMSNNRTTIQTRLIVLFETNVISEPIQLSSPSGQRLAVVSHQLRQLTSLSGAGRPIKAGPSHQPVLDQEQPPYDDGI